MFDDDNDGFVTGSEGFSSDAYLVNADFSNVGGGGGLGGIFLGERAAAATHLKGVAIDTKTARLEWTLARAGNQGTLPIMYKIKYQII